MIDMADPLHLVAVLAMLAGLTFDLIGCLGLVRLPDVYNRLQAATKCVTLGTFLILLGVLLRFGFDSMGIKAILCLWFIAITSPTAAHAIARGAHRGGIPLWEKSVTDRYAEDREASGGTSAPPDPVSRAGEGQP